MLCQQLSKEDNATLWLWSLGLTDQLLSYRISLKTYESLSQEIQKEVIRLNIGQHDRTKKNNDEFVSMTSMNNKKFGFITFERR